MQNKRFANSRASWSVVGQAAILYRSKQSVVQNTMFLRESDDFYKINFGEIQTQITESISQNIFPFRCEKCRFGGR